MWYLYQPCVITNLTITLASDLYSFMHSMFDSVCTACVCVDIYKTLTHYRQALLNTEESQQILACT